MRAPDPIGVLALQGGFAAHRQRFGDLGVPTCEVRLPSDLDRCRALVLPGGESTTMSKLLASSGLLDAISQRVQTGMKVMGTCAGMIMLAAEVLDGRPDQRSLAAIDITVRRNGYGRQIDSFETDLQLLPLGPDAPPFHGVFIRAPLVERLGDEVEVLAVHDGAPVLLRSRHAMVASFHPELTCDARVHAQFVELLEVN